MTNYERWKDFIKEHGIDFAVVDGVPVVHAGISCHDCDFDILGDCAKQRMEWVAQEYKEPEKKEEPKEEQSNFKFDGDINLPLLFFSLIVEAMRISNLNNTGGDKRDDA